MKQKFFIVLLIVIAFCKQNAFAQNWFSYDKESLTKAILNDSHPYKIIYVFCTWCKSSCKVNNFSIDKAFSEYKGDSISYWPICGDMPAEAYEYICGYDFRTPIKMLGFPELKKHGIILKNSVALVSNYIQDTFDNEANHIGSGGYVILDSNNRPIMRSDYKVNWKYLKKQDTDYDLNRLLEFIATH